VRVLVTLRSLSRVSVRVIHELLWLEPLEPAREWAGAGGEIGDFWRLSNGCADLLKNRGPMFAGNHRLGGGTSEPDPKVAEYVGMAFSFEG